MFAMLSRIFGFGSERLDAERARQMYMSSYGPRSRSITNEEAMRLVAGRALPDTRSTAWIANVYDLHMPVFAAYGDTPEQAAARADQLISALDGARRL